MNYVRHHVEGGLSQGMSLPLCQIFSVFCNGHEYSLKLMQREL